jgi:hypothetical protein
MRTIEVFARKSCSARFPITLDSPRHDVEREIMERLRSSNDILWMDDDSGISIIYIEGAQYWRPKRRFFLNGEGEW